MGFLLEVAVSAFFLAAMSAVGFLFFWRVRGIERQMSILLKAALTNTKEIRQCIAGVDRGFEGVRKSDNQHRAMLASLNSQLADLNRMVAAGVGAPELRSADRSAPRSDRQAAVPEPHINAVPPAAGHLASAGKPAIAVSLDARERGLPGYRTIRKQPADKLVAAGGDDAAARQRKIMKIEELFQKVELPVATANWNAEPPLHPAPPANDAPSGSRGGGPAPIAKFADLISQRRRVVNG